MAGPLLKGAAIHTVSLATNFRKHRGDVVFLTLFRTTLFVIARLVRAIQFRPKLDGPHEAGHDE